MKKNKDIFNQFNYVEAILLSSKANKFYLGGYYSSRGYVLLLKNEEEPIYFVDYRSIGSLDESFNTIILSKDNNSLNQVCEYIESLNISTLGLEGNNLTYNQYMLIKNNIKNINIEPIDFDLIREIKTDPEIELIKKANNIANASYKSLLNLIEVGMSEQEVAMLLVNEMIKQGADKESFDTIVLSGINGAFPHGKPSRKIIEYGDFVTIDFGVKVNGYCSDTTRTFVMGEVLDSRLSRIYEAVYEAHKVVANHAKPGVRMGDLDKLSRDVISEYGYGEYYVHHLGHSIGIEPHERPRLAKDVKQKLKKNMVLTNEPGVYIAGIGGVRIEDSFYITEDGYQSLNGTSKKLKIINSRR